MVLRHNAEHRHNAAITFLLLIFIILFLLLVFVFLFVSLIFFRVSWHWRHYRIDNLDWNRNCSFSLSFFFLRLLVLQLLQVLVLRRLLVFTGIVSKIPMALKKFNISLTPFTFPDRLFLEIANLFS